ncbi:hypothetical protein ACPCTK_22700 [Streptomyces pseudogriseolus]|uniref:hypothetical protein n=1 Tax=Streptomyces pseudogriseolus TaxID=36817 RepID=UPI003FA232DB
MIALIIPDIENPFFTSLARGVEDAAQRTSLSVVLCNFNEETDKERRYLEVALGEQMAGVIVAAASRDETDLGPLTARGWYFRCVVGSATSSSRASRPGPCSGKFCGVGRSRRRRPGPRRGAGPPSGASTCAHRP